MAQNTLLTIGMITRETLSAIENELTFTRLVNRTYDDQFAKKGAKIGNVLNVRLPVRFTSSSGQGLDLQDLTESSIPVVLNKQYQRAFAVTSVDLALNIDDFRKRFIDKAMMSMANEIDYDGLGQFVNIYNEVGTPGTPVNSTAVILAAGQRLSEEAAPTSARHLVVSPAINATMVGALTGLLNPQRKISEQYAKGQMQLDTLGFDWVMDQNVRQFTTGALGGTPLTNGVNQSGSSLITDAWTSAAAQRINAGDVFTLGSGSTGVYATNPQNGQSTGQLRQFVSLTAASSDGSGNLTMTISPAVVISGAYKNVTGQTADLAGITDDITVNVNGAASTTSTIALAFCEDAFTFVCADLPLYGGLDMADRIADDQDLKMSIRLIRDYDINTDRCPLRMDLLGGWATLYAQEAVRITN
jgi:hypothetical protein